VKVGNISGQSTAFVGDMSIGSPASSTVPNTSIPAASSEGLATLAKLQVLESGSALIAQSWHLEHLCAP